jgi:hypothetical protein
MTAACSDDESNLSPSVKGTLEWQAEAPKMETYSRYYSLQTSGNFKEDEVYQLTTDVDWITLSCDSLPSDGMLDFKVEANGNVKGRTAVIRLQARSDASQYAELELYQKGLGDDDSNDTEGDTYRIGYSYDVFSEYDSPYSLKSKVIDMNKLAKFDSETTFQSVQSATLGREEFMVESAISLQSLSYQLTKSMDKNSSFMGIRKTVKRFSNIKVNTECENFYAYSRLSKVISTESLDAGALLYVVENTKVDDLPFTDEFMTSYKKVISSTGETRTQAIKDMLNTFGTHIVSEASLGGMIDFIVTFDRALTTQLETTSESYCKKVFGKVKKSSSSSQTTYSVTSSINHNGAVEIKGGDAAKANTLKQAIIGLDNTGDIPEKELTDWFKTINTNTDKKLLEPLDFKLIPIWQLFADETISNEVLAEVLEMQMQSNNLWDDQELGLDIYQIDLTSSDFTFKNQSNIDTTLVKIMYINKKPVLEICEEYIPKLRTDSRVKVFYPIYNGKTNLSQGFFPGDGNGNRPAYLSFYQGDVYVNPVEDMGYYDVANTAYYMHGNLYHTNYGALYKTKSQYATDVRYEQMRPSEWKKGYAVVKIGSGYWTRDYIRQSMMFGYSTKSGFKVYEVITDDLLFANANGSNRGIFLSANKGIFGPDVDASYGKSNLWYIPLSEDRESLTKYLGSNLKALFKGQVSGFEAAFEGFYGSRDDAGNMYDDMKNQRRFQNEKCYIVFKDGSTASKGSALLLSPNYTWDTIEITSRYNYYPIKLYRTSYFIHQDLK